MKYYSADYVVQSNGRGMFKIIKCRTGPIGTLLTPAAVRILERAHPGKVLKVL